MAAQVAQVAQVAPAGLMAVVAAPAGLMAVVAATGALMAAACTAARRAATRGGRWAAGPPEGEAGMATARCDNDRLMSLHHRLVGECLCMRLGLESSNYY